MNRREALFATATGGLWALSTGSKAQASSPVTFDGITLDPTIAAGYHRALAELVQARDVGPTESQVSAAIDWSYLLSADAVVSGFAARVDLMMDPSNPNGLVSGPVPPEAIAAVEGALLQIGISVQMPAILNFEIAAAANQRLGGLAGLMSFFANHMLASLYPATASSPLAVARRAVIASGRTGMQGRMRANDYYGCQGAARVMSLFGAVTYGLAIPTYLGCVPCAALVLSMAPAAAVVSIYQFVSAC